MNLVFWNSNLIHFTYVHFLDIMILGRNRKITTFVFQSFQGYPEIYPVGLKFVTVSDFEKTIENNKMP